MEYEHFGDSVDANPPRNGQRNEHRNEHNVYCVGVEVNSALTTLDIVHIARYDHDVGVDLAYFDGDSFVEFDASFQSMEEGESDSIGIPLWFPPHHN